MGNSKDRKPVKPAKQKGARTDAPDEAGTAWWRRPLVWIGTIILTPALVAALNGPLQFGIGKIIEVLTPDVGPPIEAVVTVQHPILTGVSLPQPQALSDQDLESLRGLTVEQQVDWLQENRQGIPLGHHQLKMQLSSNRPHAVRVTDLRAASECEEPSRGSIVKTVLGGVGTASNSLMFRLHADRPGSGAEIAESDKEPAPFFPNKTITLTGEEEQYLVVDLEASSRKLCHAEVELRVVDGDKEVRQIVSPGGKVSLLPFREEDFEADYQSVYLAGNICKRPVLAPKNYLSDPRAACGPDNLGPELTGDW